jgi:hypothetical protein
MFILASHGARFSIKIWGTFEIHFTAAAGATLDNTLKVFTVVAFAVLLSSDVGHILP